MANAVNILEHCLLRISRSSKYTISRSSKYLSNSMGNVCPSTRNPCTCMWEEEDTCHMQQYEQCLSTHTRKRVVNGKRTKYTRPQTFTPTVVVLATCCLLLTSVPTKGEKARYRPRCALSLAPAALGARHPVWSPPLFRPEYVCIYIYTYVHILYIYI